MVWDLGSKVYGFRLHCSKPGEKAAEAEAKDVERKLEEQVPAIGFTWRLMALWVSGFRVWGV